MVDVLLLLLLHRPGMPRGAVAASSCSATGIHRAVAVAAVVVVLAGLPPTNAFSTWARGHRTAA